LSQTLAQKLAEREAELVEHHKRLLELESAQKVASERQRLMRDMHDGLGSTLTSSLVAIQRGELEMNGVVEMLRECVDELRIIIDSLAPGEQDLVAVLASLRFRMERRLRATGIHLEWAIDDLPPITWLGPAEVMHVLRILQEALANVIKHAQARHVRVSLALCGEEVELRCCDDGRGFDPREPPSWGRGLRSMLQRTEILGATLELLSEPTRGSDLRLHLPLSR
jgi:signal transduction histidine kinase